jgi:diguanylate cyclase (GGDEF)-like protein/PAS domain S-box-containing protein
VPRTLSALLLLLAAIGVAVAATPQNTSAVDFAANDPLIDLGKSLSLYHAPSSTAPDGSVWYMMTATNDSVRPATRILLAGQPAGASVRFFPRRARPSIRQIASSDAEVTIEPARAYGRRAFRVIVPPASSAALAIRMSDADAQPTVQAWSEAALIAHDRQLAIFFAAVAGLMAAALVITAGLAFMTSHAPPRWAAILIAAIFLTLLASTGVFDAGWFTAVGGPYGFSIMIAGFSLAAGLRLADTIVPAAGLWPSAKRWQKWAPIAIVALSILSFVGMPGAMLLTEIAVVAGSGAITAYLVHRGRLGAQAARVVAPSAAVFSLVATAAAVAALGGFQDNPAAPAIVGGFAAAGTVLLALAIAAGEGIAVLQVLGAPRPVAVVQQISEPTVQASAPFPANAATASALRAIGASHQGVFELDFRADVVRLSAEGAALIGMTGGAENMRHTAWIARVHPEDRDTYKQAMADYRGHVDLAFRIELRVRSESGRYPWFELRATMLGSGARADRCLGLMADITSRKEAEETPVERPLNDPLTGLGNRAAMMAALERASSAAIFALLDIDRFKSVHANLGDAGGDAILSALAQRLSKQFGDRAEIFRAGGDSFALLFNGGDPAGIGEETINACKGSLAYNGRTVFVSASTGVATGHDAKDAQEIIANAEIALSQTKQRGGGHARVYMPGALSEVASDPVALETDLRRALEANEFEIFYQPIVNLDDGSVAGFEALLRWRHPSKGLIAPGDFIAHCEETGLIVAIGRLVLERAAMDLAQWQKYFPLTPALFTSVNLSRRQLHDDGLKDFLAGLLNRCGVAPGSLKIEVTESAAGAQGGSTAVLTEIQALGVGLAIDDFGTGLSALSELKDLPFDTIKIDRSFLSTKADASPDGAVILASIVKLARDLGRVVVVEGVEAEEDAMWLREQGCHFAQGFFFSVPLATDEVLKFIAQHYRHEAPAVSGASGGG